MTRINQSLQVTLLAVLLTALSEGCRSEAPPPPPPPPPPSAVASPPTHVTPRPPQPPPRRGPSVVGSRPTHVTPRPPPPAPRPGPSGVASPPTHPNPDRVRFAPFRPNAVGVAAETPVSTFSIDVDSASYTFVRRRLTAGILPRHDAVRVEELINYFPYNYPLPKDRSAPFSVSASVLPTPWNSATKILHIGIKGYELRRENRPHANLVFLVDTSGSMNMPDKLPLAVNSFNLLLNALEPDDTVAVVTYAESVKVALEPTRVAKRKLIRSRLANLRAKGYTAGGEALLRAYALAERHFVRGGVNRVLLATDGDFNVGVDDPEELKQLVERKRESGVYLSVLGFGQDNYHDALMQALAQSGNGHAAYIDSLLEARKVLLEEATSTLFPIAKDVKVQVEFNPAAVSEYRLVGYETRLLEREDFSNDKVDAGEIGSGHTVTAIYEITPVGSGAERVEPLRYGPHRAVVNERSGPVKNAGDSDGAIPEEYAYVKIRYKLPESDTSGQIERAVTRADEIGDGSQEARFATAVAGFGQLLRKGHYTGDFGYRDVISLARGAMGEDLHGLRREFVRLAGLAQDLTIAENTFGDDAIGEANCGH